MDEEEIRCALQWLVVDILNHTGQPQNPAQLPNTLKYDIDDVVSLFKDIDNG